MQRNLQSLGVVLAGVIFFHACATAQQKPSFPISELTTTAGQDIIFDVPLTGPFNAPFIVSATYVVEGAPANFPMYAPPPTQVYSFSCRGDASPQNTSVRVVCNTTPYAKPGVYRVDSHGLRMVREDTFEDEYDSTLRFPIVTLKEARHPAKSGFPGRGQPLLFTTIHEALEDEADRTQHLSDVVVKHYLEGEGQPKEETAYLLDVIGRQQAILKLTSDRFTAVLNASHRPLPIFFEDFDERLKQLRSDVQEPHHGQARDIPLRLQPHIVLAQQIPHTTDSVEAQSSKNPIKKNYADLVEIMADLIELPARILDDGTSEFEWSLIATPPGAEVYYSRLHKEENHWAGGTPVEKAKLPYARWTWRIAWGDCSKSDRPDPYHQQKIVMKEVKDGCKTK